MVRDTKARWKKKPPFLGIEGGTTPLMIAIVFSAVLLMGAARQRTQIWPFFAAFAPFICTYAYMFVFIHGRRPYYARDLFMMLGPGTKAMSPPIPRNQPIHPAYGKRPRGLRCN